MNNNNQNNPVLDAVAMFSFYIAIKNLQENSQQTEMLKQHLDDQDEKYLKKAIVLLEKSILQNEIIIQQNKELLERK